MARLQERVTLVSANVFSNTTIINGTVCANEQE